ncbi:transcription initiation factor IIA large subunit-like isoform X1 [Glycine soja]|uniref:Transcription initiation factor IIA large subunit isoform B n=1 Tax=Glycine soja TaxID=3848 RepID=A0A445IDX3_GLYSO|nr:transcription initiation factor IIA large subunit-like isoform X1 [Glycine soja]RZB84250.1 Transcription initiation factor IIA large subunit isoform B [Glycine soja]
MAASTTSQVYIDVIEDVMVKVRDEFVNNGGPGEEVLKELQAMWESKMMQAGAVLGPIERSTAAKPTPGGPITPVHDLNVPYEGTDEYETPTADMLFPPTPLQTPIQTPLPGTGDNSTYNIPTGPSDYPSSGNDTGGNADGKGARPAPYMQSPSPWMNQRPPLDVNVAYVEGRDEADRGTSNQPPTQDFFTMPSGKRKRNDLTSQYNAGGYIPQQDGAGDATHGDFEIEVPPISQHHIYHQDVCISFVSGRGISINSHHTISKGKMSADLERSTSRIPQLDGPIPYDDDVLSTPNIYNYGEVFSEDYNISNTPAPPEVPASTPALLVQNEVGNDFDDDDDDEPPLNEEDDDDLDDMEQGEDQNTHHLVLAQFDKVTRTKSRWKCTLKDGIMHINNKDILFNKATGEFEF